MKNKQVKELSFPAEMTSLNDILEFSQTSLKAGKINEKLLIEYRLVIEEIIIKLITQAPQGSMLTIEVAGYFNKVALKFGCPGKMVSLRHEDELDFGGKIIEEYEDYVNQSYVAGTNYVVFSTYNSLINTWNLQSIVLALIAAVILRLLLPQEELTSISENLLYPFNTFYVDCMQALATPVVFLSTVTMIIKLYQKFDHDRYLKHLFLKYLTTSLIAIILGFGTWKMLSIILPGPDLSGYLTSGGYTDLSSLEDFVEASTFTSIFQIFEMTNPIPMLLLAIVLGFAACNVFGKEGTTIRHWLLSLSGLCAKTLTILYDALPFFIFFALLSNLITDTQQFLTGIGVIIIMTMLISILMFIVYVIELKTAGVSLRAFRKDYKDILLENLKIGSNIKAIPYNKRMLSKKLHMPSDIIKDSLQLGGMVNMDGNCLFISAFSIFFLYAFGIHITLGMMVMIALIILLLSIGAPNQPGSFLIAIIFIMNLVGISSDYYDFVIFAEALLGSIYSFINTAGDIVVLAANDQPYRQD